MVCTVDLTDCGNPESPSQSMYMVMQTDWHGVVTRNWLWLSRETDPVGDMARRIEQIWKTLPVRRLHQRLAGMSCKCTVKGYYNKKLLFIVPLDTVFLVDLILRCLLRSGTCNWGWWPSIYCLRPLEATPQHSKNLFLRSRPWPSPHVGVYTY